MAKTDWRFTDTVIPEDLNGIGEEINGLRTEMSTRFDHEATTPLTLQPGFQVVHAEKDARFKLGEIRGRTLVNLLGGAGDCENLGEWNLAGNQLPTLDTAKKKYGSSSISLVRSLPLIDSYIYRVVKLKPGAKYVAIQEINIASTTGDQGVFLSIQQPSLGEVITNKSADMSMLNVWQPVFAKFTGDSATDNTINIVALVGWGTNGDISVNVDGIRLYEISEAEYSALDKMTAEEVGMKYPFVSPGIFGVKSPYVINTSGNLLPPFYEWERSLGGGNPKVVAPYILETNDVNWYPLSYTLSCIPNTEYTISVNVTGSKANYSIRTLDSSKSIIARYDPADIQLPLAILTESNAAYIAVLFGKGVDDTGELVRFDSPTLTIGSDSQPFQPQRKSMLAFDTELHANPTDGSEQDVLFEQNGEYKKLAKWRKVVLDGNLTVGIFNNYLSEFKVVQFSKAAVDASGQLDNDDEKLFGLKCNGMILVVDDTPVYNWPSSDLIRINSTNVYVSISNTDSGWGDHYTPTQDEIRAYFYGWRLANPDNWSVPYPGTGTKAWGRLDRNGNLIAGSGTSTLPTFLNTEGGFTPYQLLYRLAKETVEPVLTEGSLLLSEGDNSLEVGTGIVLREGVKPPLSTNPNLVDRREINFTAEPSSTLMYKVNRILNIYKDSTVDSKWTISNGTELSPVINSYGLSRANISGTEFDKTGGYSVTYIKLDKFPMQQIIGMLATNEKAQIGDLTAGVAEALQRVSVVEQKKAEKDGPGWITPTLLNGWFGILGFAYRINNGKLEFRGGIQRSTPVLGDLMVMPAGVRPSISTSLALGSFEPSVSASTCVMDFFVTGKFVIINLEQRIVIFEGLTISLN